MTYVPFSHNISVTDDNRQTDGTSWHRRASKSKQ